MPGLVRKLVIYAGRDGLILQSHGADHQSVAIEYKTRKVFPVDKGVSGKHEGHLESHGVIGLITVASLSFLIAITRRDQVAQIFGKPVYVVADVAIVPLSSQSEANAAIVAASRAQHTDDALSESEYSESDDEQHSATATDLPDSPTEDEGPYTHRNRSNTSIAEDVAKRKASYGKFASQWFSKQVWGSSNMYNRGKNFPKSRTSETDAKSSIELQNYADLQAIETNQESRDDTANKEDIGSGSITSASALSLLPKILRSTKMILSSRSFFFAYDFDLTRRLCLQERRSSLANTREKLDPLYFWNKRMGSTFVDAGQDAFLMPIIQGFVGQRSFTMRAERKGQVASVNDTKEENTPDPERKASVQDQEQSYLLTLISRRSVKRSGLRYLRRGIDDEGNCANAVETEQILSSQTWDREFAIRSFVQIRGSIPLYFSQSPYSFKPVPMLHNSSFANEAAFKQHFLRLQSQYGSVQIAMLVDKHGTEVNIGNAYENLYEKLREDGQFDKVKFEWFDFHAECRGMKFENVQKLVDKFASDIAAWGENVIIGDTLQKAQSGIIRTNCMDCLDRTNVAQSAFGQHVLQRDLAEDGYTIDLLHDESTNWFNTLWADNGDAISRQYASTAALKGDFTRTRKRNWRGQMNDLGLTLSRYYSNMVNDYFSQAVIDVLLGNISWKVFEDFENSMMSEDPGISVESAREVAIENCSKIVIQNSDEDLIHGWTLLTPAQENTLRTLPFEETVVLLTDCAIYCCKFDWETEKVASFEKIDLRSISKIRMGIYITSTFTERQLDEQLNQGLVIVFTPGKGDVIRINTRSLSNSLQPETNSDSSADGGTGILSWFQSRTTSRMLALKMIPRNTVLEAEDGENSKAGDLPQALARHICDEIKRAVVGADHVHEHPGFIEEGDIISAADAKRRTGYLEQLGHSIKKMVWV